ncbi:gamma-glutamyltranspeptidase-domain-containing protein [Aspergillus avenaceus]|uniref:Glutathione hydrolase n=1 Tax=Aspergillus avenaceus TaxID=36643 RepID=A0A5N6TIQ6_ASPAV|nr:gamma-glutamyltranspeptidase-domain-containing protein [Aspergillus avenaceus]
MPSRRSHTKSRKGCLQCKRRHVKCDEELPRCSLCQKRKLQCTYPEGDGQPSTPQEAMDAIYNSNEHSLSTRMLEMKLFHLYLTETYLTLYPGRLDASHFQSAIPRLATAYPFCLDALLAFSALHLASKETTDNRTWVESALMYQNRACSAMSRVLAEFSVEYAGPAFICSILIMLCSYAYPCVSQDDQPFDPLAQVLEIRRLIAGCAFFFNQLGKMEHPGELAGWLRYKEDDNSDDGILKDAVLQSLERIKDMIRRVDGPRKDVYEDTWEFLYEAVKRPMGGREGGVIALPIRISDNYVELLKEGDWMARVLFLHYGVGMHLLSDRWFVKDWGRRLVSTVLQPLKEIPSEWAGTVTWTREAVRKDGQDAEKQPLLTPHILADSKSTIGSSYEKKRRPATMGRAIRISLTITLFLVLIVTHLPDVLSSPVEHIIQRRDHGVHSLDDGKRGAVASESAICSRHGTDILRMGGNAADAMVSTMLCVGVAGMYHSGIGGGGYMLVRAPNGTFEFIDFRETAPAAAFQDMFINSSDASTIGGLASGVPGEIRGLEYLHKHYGSLPWSAVVQPAVQTAREGFLVGRDLVHYMESAVGDGEDFLSKNPTWAIDFAPNGTRLGLGDHITFPRLANTLETIANNGPDAFYSGPIAETMINALQAANGTMTLEDLRNYSVAIRDYSQIEYRGYKVTSTTAPSSGAVAMSILKILDTYDDFMTPENVNLSTHRLDEAIKFGYGMRTMLGDPSFVEGMDEYQKNMVKQSTIDEIRSKISDLHTQNVSVYDPSGIESLETHGTSHMTTADNSGLTISAITTINLLFGSRVMVPETGIIMNNEMDDFSTPGSSNSFGYIPSEANYIRPGKRPLSSLTPTIVTHPNGSVYLATGSAGGSRIITATVQNVIHVIDEGLSAAEALAKPRLHDQLIPNRVQFEYAYDNGTVAFMKSLGHNVTWVAPGSSTAQAIRVLPNGTFDAAGEPRQLDSGGFSI